MYREAGVLADLIQRWKYGGDLAVGESLANFFGQRMRHLWPRYDLVVPVPLHRSKLRHRGFNQASVLARGLPCPPDQGHRVAPGLLRRCRATPAQARTVGPLRAANVAHAFACPPLVPGRRILLVDDVLTSGATATACARILLAAGAELVDVAVLGRTAPPKPPEPSSHLSLDNLGWIE